MPSDRQLRRADSFTYALSIGVLALAALAGTASCKRLAALAGGKPAATFGRPRVDAEFQEMAEKVATDPKFQQALKRGSQAAEGEKLNLAVTSTGNRELGAQLSARGAARLEPAEFLELMKLKVKLAEASPKLCAGFWSGGLATADLAVGLDALSDAELHRWFELSEHAMHLELYATTPLPRFAGKDLVAGLRDIKAELAPAAAETLANTMNVGVAAPPQAGCLAYLQLTRGGMHLPDGRRDVFLRTLTFDSLVDW